MHNIISLFMKFGGAPKGGGAVLTPKTPLPGSARYKYLAPEVRGLSSRMIDVSAVAITSKSLPMPN